MRHTQTFENFLNEGDITITLDYNTDPDDIDYVSGILKKAQVPAIVKAGLDSEEVEITISKAHLNKANAALRADGFDLRESVNEGSSNTEILDLVDQIQKVIKDLKADKTKSKSDVDKLYTLSSPLINQLHKLI